MTRSAIGFPLRKVARPGRVQAPFGIIDHISIYIHTCVIDHNEEGKGGGKGRGRE